MGNGQSTPLGTCLDAICDGRANCISYPSNPIYQISWVKPYNLQIPVTPAAVIRPDNAQEVAKAVKCASENNVKVQAKSGGHSFGNFGTGGKDGALMIDLVNLKDFSMDEKTWQAKVGAGLRLGELDEHLHANGGRAMAHGTCPSVGIGGHATIGGLGPMSRMWGSALDHILSVQVVTANGTLLQADENTNPDLFYAIRGAGASFGIVTEFTVKTHPEPEPVVEYSYAFSFGSHSEMADVYRKWQDDLVADPKLDRRFSTMFIAQPLGALITGTFYGTEDEYKKTGILDKIPLGGVIDANLTNWFGHLTHQAEVEAMYLSSLPSAFYTKSLAFRKDDLLSNDSIASLFETMDKSDSGTPLWFIIFNSEGGAMADTPTNATSYPHRDKIMMYQSYGIGVPTVSQQTRKFLDDVDKKIRQGAPNAKSTYAGYIDVSLDADAAQEFYWAEQLPRLQSVKQVWDPEEVFWNPQSVRPAKKK